MQLHNNGLSANVDGAGHNRAPKREECCSGGRNVSGETVLTEKVESCQAVYVVKQPPQCV